MTSNSPKINSQNSSDYSEIKFSIQIHFLLSLPSPSFHTGAFLPHGLPHQPTSPSLLGRLPILVLRPALSLSVTLLTVGPHLSSHSFSQHPNWCSRRPSPPWSAPVGAAPLPHFVLHFPLNPLLTSLIKALTAIDGGHFPFCRRPLTPRHFPPCYTLAPSIPLSLLFKPQATLPPHVLSYHHLL
jgi:hypothetical protein